MNMKDIDRTQNELKTVLKAMAYELLIRCNITNLPIDYHIAFKEVSKLHPIRIYSYQFLTEITSDSIDYYIKYCGEYGGMFYSTELSSYIIYFNEDLPDDMVNWVMFNILGVIKLGLVPCDAIITIKEAVNCFAEDFAYYFSAPDVVLEKCGAKNPDDIMRICGLPFHQAYSKLRKLKNNFFTGYTALDKIIQKHFNDFIQQHSK